MTNLRKIRYLYDLNVHKDFGRHGLIAGYVTGHPQLGVDGFVISGFYLGILGRDQSSHILRGNRHAGLYATKTSKTIDIVDFNCSVRL